MCSKFTIFLDDKIRATVQLITYTVPQNCLSLFTIHIQNCSIFVRCSSEAELQIFRWFKFTLKPPYSIMCGKLQLAIWDTSFWTFFGQIWTQGILRHILGPILVIFEICQFLTIPGPFEYFSENGWSQKIAFYSETDDPYLDIQIWFYKERSLD